MILGLRLRNFLMTSMEKRNLVLVKGDAYNLKCYIPIMPLEKLFHSRSAIKGKCCNLIIDGGSCKVLPLLRWFPNSIWPPWNTPHLINCNGFAINVLGMSQYLSPLINHIKMKCFVTSSPWMLPFAPRKTIAILSSCYDGFKNTYSLHL